MTRAPQLQLPRPADRATDATGSTRSAAPEPPPSHRRQDPAGSLLDQAEATLLGFVVDLLHAPEGAAGQVVAGAHEAALVVLRGARDARPTAGQGSVVLAQSAHPAYFTAAATVGLVPLVVPVDADGRAPLGAMAAAIRDDTVLVVASAPSYTHGAVDPIGWIAAATTVREVPLHVDATSGGWALAYAERAGRVGPAWGFAVGGVDSIAVDVGPGPGTVADLAVVLHRAPGDAGADTTPARGPLDLRAGTTRPGALLAEVVETLDAVGHEGCSALALRSLDATAAVVDGLLDQRGVQVATRPDATVVTLRADASCDVVAVAEGLHARGWVAHAVQPEAGPPLLRLPVTTAVAAAVPDLLVAVADSVVEAQGHAAGQAPATSASTDVSE